MSSWLILLYVIFLSVTTSGLYTLTGPTISAEGYTVTFTCITSPVPEALIWSETSNSSSKNYVYFYNSARRRCQRSTGENTTDYKFDCNSTGVFTLSFPANYIRHNGSVFQCRNAGGDEESKERTLTVTMPLTMVTLLNATKSTLSVVQDTNLTLVCETNPTYPVSTVSWRRDGQLVSQGVTSSTRQKTEGVVAVSVWYWKVQWAHRGAYYCEALNSGVNRTSQNLTLSVKVPVLYVTLTNITINNQSVPVNQGSSLVLTCQTSPAYPPPTVTWYNSSSMMSSGVDSRTETQTNGQIVTVSTMTRTMRKTNDQDTFYCRAENINGYERKQSKKARADVFYPPDIILSPVEGSQNTNLTLTCRASGNPSNYRFEEFRQYWGDQLIQRRGGTHTGDRYSLDLPQVSYQDSGVYVCTVGNNVKQPSHKNTTVIVEASPVYTKDLDATEPVGAEVGQTAMLVQYVYCRPNFTSVSWHFNTTNSTNSRLSADSSNISSSPVHLDVYGTQVEVAGFKLVYTVASFQQEHIGFYTIRVCNGFGCANSSVKLVASGPPMTPLNFRALNSTTDSVTLTWTPQYTGGDYTQEFHVEFRVQNTSGDWSSRVFPLSQDNSGAGVVDGLDSNTGYVFRIKSVTDRKTGNNQSSVSEQVFFTTKETRLPQVSALPLGAIAGGVVGGLGIFILVAVLLVFLKRRKLNKGGDRERIGSNGRNREIVMSDVHGAEARAAENAVVVYAEVKKKKKPVTDVYTEVKKPNKRQQKKETTTTAKTKRARDDVYENAVPRQYGDDTNTYANAGFDGDQPERNNENTQPPIGRDADGCLYVGIDFGSTKPGKVIIGKEKGSYVDIAYSKVGPPPPPDEDDEDEKTK